MLDFKQSFEIPPQINSTLPTTTALSAIFGEINFGGMDYANLTQNTAPNNINPSDYLDFFSETIPSNMAKIPNNPDPLTGVDPTANPIFSNDGNLNHNFNPPLPANLDLNLSNVDPLTGIIFAKTEQSSIDPNDAQNIQDAVWQVVDEYPPHTTIRGLQDTILNPGGIMTLGDANRELSKSVENFMYKIVPEIDQAFPNLGFDKLQLIVPANAAELEEWAKTQGYPENLINALLEGVEGANAINYKDPINGLQTIIFYPNLTKDPERFLLTAMNEIIDLLTSEVKGSVVSAIQVSTWGVGKTQWNPKETLSRFVQGALSYTNHPVSWIPIESAKWVVDTWNRLLEIFAKYDTNNLSFPERKLGLVVSADNQDGFLLSEVLIGKDTIISLSNVENTLLGTRGPDRITYIPAKITNLGELSTLNLNTGNGEDVLAIVNKFTNVATGKGQDVVFCVVDPNNPIANINAGNGTGDVVILVLPENADITIGNAEKVVVIAAKRAKVTILPPTGNSVKPEVAIIGDDTQIIGQYTEMSVEELQGNAEEIASIFYV